MSLLSTDITKVKRLSLRDVKLPTTERRVEPILGDRYYLTGSTPF